MLGHASLSGNTGNKENGNGEYYILLGNARAGDHRIIMELHNAVGTLNRADIKILKRLYQLLWREIFAFYYWIRARLPLI